MLNFVQLNFFAVDGEVISAIGKGLCVLIGISRDDTAKDIEFMWVLLTLYNKIALKGQLTPKF